MLVAFGVGFSLLCLARGSAQRSVPGGIKSKQKFDNFEKSAIFAWSLMQMVAVLFTCLYSGTSISRLQKGNENLF